MSPGDDETQEGRLQLRECQIIGGNMPPDVVDRDQGLVQGQGSRLMAMIGVMLITFFAALAAHYWVGQKMQQKLAPTGTPKTGARK